MENYFRVFKGGIGYVSDKFISFSEAKNCFNHRVRLDRNEAWKLVHFTDDGQVRTIKAHRPSWHACDFIDMMSIKPSPLT